MSKKCSICNKKVGIYHLKFSDGIICQQCVIRYKFGTLFKWNNLARPWAREHSINDLKKLISEGKDFSDVTDFSDVKAKTFADKLEVASVALDEINKGEQEKLDVIKQQLKDANVENLFGTKKEIKALPDIIDIDGGEKILYAANAFIETNSILAVCTNKRVIFLDHGLIYGSKSTDIPLDMINGVSYSKGLMLGSIAVTNGAITTQIENMQPYPAKKMAETIKQAAADFKQTSAQSNHGSNLSELRELKGLLDDGIITKEEFAAKKKQILGI